MTENLLALRVGLSNESCRRFQIESSEKVRPSHEDCWPAEAHHLVWMTSVLWYVGTTVGYCSSLNCVALRWMLATRAAKLRCLVEVRDSRVVSQGTDVCQWGWLEQYPAPTFTEAGPI